MKIWKMVAPLVLLVIAVAAFGCGWSTVASVNGSKITEKEFQTKLEEQHGQAVLEQLMVEKLVAAEAARKGVTVSDAEVDEEFSRIKGMFPSEKEFADAVKQYYGMSVDMLKERIKLDKLANKLRTADVKVSDADLKKYVEERRYVRHILLQSEPEAKAIRKLIEEGSDFVKLASQRSIDPGSKSRGGLLGFVKKGDMVAEFEKAAFSLKEGEISPVIKSRYGYHIIRVDKPDMKEAAEALKKDKAKPVNEWLTSLRKSARIKVYRTEFKGIEAKFAGKDEAAAPQPQVGGAGE